ncbi:MAG TPA: YciI family protein [Candidatus Methylacidiphilales bacterium]|nr:YciI family protein [Candidatus Methylacidiphilales bacterium]
MNSTHLTSDKSEYLLLIRGHEWHAGYSVEEIQEAMTKFQEWFQSLEKKGILKGARPLQRSGKVISGKGGKHVADGPFAESKEAVGGYLMLAAGSFDEALAITKSAPMLEHGVTIELRELADECPIMEKLRQAEAGKQLAGAGV